MDANDLSARFRQAAGAEPEPRARDSAESYRIRARMIGVLLMDARVNAGRSVEECAHYVQVSSAQIEAWEYGDSGPSLPQLELLAYFLNVPVSHFWGAKTLEVERERHHHPLVEFMTLRDHMIGALMRQARLQAAQSLDDLSAATGLNAALLEQYELGELPLPVEHLTVIASALGRPMRYFLESSSYIGELLLLREELKRFAMLPEELREFAANPLNAGFLEIALMLSQMPTDRLRRIGESILNITM